MNTIYQLRIELQHFRPLIYRYVEVDASINFETLHYIIQDSMGWTNSHLYSFEIDKNTRIEDTKMFDEEPIQGQALDVYETDMSKYLTAEKQKIRYIYDFGDNWNHIITLKKIRTPEPGVLYPRCIKAQGACPPEDCGGVWGYENLLTIIKDPKHPQYEDYVDWVDEDFDPSHVDMSEINAYLQS